MTISANESQWFAGDDASSYRSLSGELDVEVVVIGGMESPGLGDN